MASLAMLDTADFVPSESILQLKARTLRNQTTPRRGRPASSAPDPELLAPLVDLYNQHEGDLDAIFNALAEDGGKAKKYPPASAEDFATKYVNGKYTYVSNLDTIREKVVGKSGGEDMFADLPDLIEDPVVPGMEDEETAVHPVDVLADMFPDVPEEIVLQVWEASGENLEEAAAGLWFMKILQAFMQAGATTVPLPEVPLEDMSIRELMAEIRKEGLDASNCIEKTELIELLQEHRASKAAA